MELCPKVQRPDVMNVKAPLNEQAVTVQSPIVVPSVARLIVETIERGDVRPPKPRQAQQRVLAENKTFGDEPSRADRVGLCFDWVIARSKGGEVLAL
jgi:hypothetical protein